MDAPRIGDIAHYVSFGTPGGEYTSQCRAAIVTEVTHNPDGDWHASLCVLNPTGQFFRYHDGGETPSNESHCPHEAAHGSPFRYCPCGWMEARFKGGTWHAREDCDR